MLQNFLHKILEKKLWLVIALPVWVFVSFIIAQVIVSVIVEILLQFSINLAGINQATLTTVVGAIIYILTVAMVIGLPWLVKKYKTSLTELGLNKLPKWFEWGFVPLGLLIYLILSAVLAYFAGFLPFVDANQVQETGFSQISQPFELVLAFIMLIIIAPVAEEVLFRGYLLGKLRRHVPVWVAVIVTSVLFGIVHGAWNVGIDVFALSLVLCTLRITTKSLWPSMLLHMTKNAIAFYLLFINPTLLATLGG